MRTRRFSSGILKTFWKLCRTLDHAGSTSVRPAGRAAILAAAASLTACARTVSACGEVAVAQDLHERLARAPDEPGLHQGLGIRPSPPCGKHRARRPG